VGQGLVVAQQSVLREETMIPLLGAAAGVARFGFRATTWPARAGWRLLGDANRLFAQNQAMELLSRMTPTASRSVAVIVVGKATANLRRLYEFAVGVASGVAGSFQINSSHSIECRIDYRRKIITAVITHAAAGVFQANSFRTGADLIRSAPRDPIVGADMPKFVKFPSSDKFAGGAPILPLEVKDVVVGKSDPAANPGLTLGQGTFDPGNTKPVAAALKTPCDVPQPAVNDTFQAAYGVVAIGGGLAGAVLATPDQVLQRLKQLFGVQ
jgi:hypothetical protein